MRTLLAVVITLGAAAAQASEAPPGAASCSGCHATNPAAQTSVPKLHGKPAAEIVAEMADFRTDKKPSTVMNRIAKGFTEAETQAMADWLAAQK